MEQNNLQSEKSGQHNPSQIVVAFLGFKAEDEENFARFFQVARIDKPNYTAANPTEKLLSHILMVNYDDPAALAEKQSILVTHPHIQIVAVSRGPLEEPPEHHIRGMLFAARVLTTLDKVDLKLVSGANVEQAPIAETPAFQPQAVAETPVPAPEPQVQSPLVSAPTPIAVEVADLPTSDKVSDQHAATPQPQVVVTTLSPQLEEKAVPQVQIIQAETVLPTPVPASADKAVEGGGYRALVVDDSLAIQKSLEINLATLPQISVIDFADSGEIALEKAEAMQYDLIFLDVMMPGIDGYETCTRLRKKPEYKKTPIIMVSGKTSPLDEVKGVMAGCTTYLTKPVQQEAFQKLSIRVLTWLEKQKKP
jgi:two-component system, cell cycle response regulator